MDWKDPNIAKKYKPGEAMTGPFARPLIKQAGLDDSLSPTSGEKLVTLDNACGTGILTVHLYDMLPDHAKGRINHTCGDISQGMIDLVQSRIKEAGWKGATTKILDAQKMDIPSNTFTHVLTNFGFVGLPDPSLVLREWHRVLQPGGTCGFTVWESVGWYSPVEAAVKSLDGPKFPTWTEFCKAFSTTDDAWEERSFFERGVEAVGFEDMRVESFENRTKHASAREFCELYGMMCRVITEKFWSEEEKGKYGPLLEPAIEKALQERFGEGEFSLDWKAWIITAKKPVEKN
ncbi:COQ5 family methyltransferase [Lasiodiplodia theobromae]|uniref:COQ5 family methyltransferase n=1 Tax=Lasiodiplodia theobromae TaxID=45133 RepID=UPI0015C33DD5|nr:COQ5 family methyltransferase [Lasiodiplodia theobromae]KAF4542154.1 COQ5 family methyltransferase [Lasiodiplodia theobromae]